jgi:hypothetical protein
MGIKPHWVLFRKFFRLKPQPSANDLRVVGGADIQMREDAAEQYLSYKLIDSNQGWKLKWFYITNHHLELPKPSGKHVVWTSLGPLPRWVPGPTTRWAPGTTRLALHGT